MLDHIAILKELEKKGVGVQQNISPLIIKKNKRPVYYKVGIWRDETLLILKSLKESNLINIDIDYYSRIITPSSPGIKEKWFDEVECLVVLNTNGLLYIKDYKRRRFQFWTTLTCTIIAILSLFYTIWLNHGVDSKLNHFKNKVDSIQYNIKK